MKFTTTFNILVNLLGLFSLVLSEYTKNNEYKWEVYFDQNWVQVKLGVPQTINFEVEYFNATKVTDSSADIHIISSNLNVAQIDVQFAFEFHNNKWEGNFTVNPISIGRTDIIVEIESKSSTIKSEITVGRNQIFNSQSQILFERFLHLVFIFLNIIFGVALNLKKVVAILRKPIALIVSILFTCMILPLSSIVLGSIFLYDYYDPRTLLIVNAILAMAVIFSSNCWTVILDGDVNLSITISVIINFLSWVITSFCVQPTELLFENLSRLAEIHKFSLHQFFIPLGFGLFIQYFFPLTTRFAPTILKMLTPIAIFNLHLSYLLYDLDLFFYGTLNWKWISLAIILPVVVYLITWTVTLSMKLDYKDCSTIAIEAVMKQLCLVLFVIPSSDQLKERINFAPEFSSTCLFTTSSLLVIHTAWKKLRQSDSHRLPVINSTKSFGKQISQYSLLCTSKLKKLIVKNTREIGSK